MRRMVLGLNAAVAAASAAAAVVGVLHPTLVLPAGIEPTAGLRMYAQAYAVRAVPLAAALVYLLRGERSALVPVLAVAGVAQLGDVYIGLDQGIAGMAVGGTLSAGVHLTSAWWLARRPGTRVLKGLA
ncbi:hypothetical protein ABZ454_05375 [Streptomyces sp. NPDC005803]|uniref:hypothetical protein n=1 Tax=Streptomyces sp. NPDC005803 TaxID=3154297 RepID=UPI0033F587C5